MRLDKYLKVSRLIKRRTVANNLAEAGRIKINEKVAKPATKVKVGDTISFSFGEQETRVKVKEIANVVRKEDSANMYELL